jgi:hypothetical protein
MRTSWLSHRITVLNHTLDPSPIMTLPKMAAVSAMKTLGSMFRKKSPSGVIVVAAY